MENVNQDAMLNQQSQTVNPETGGPIQVPDEGEMLNQDYNPTDLSGDANTVPSTPTDEQEQQSGNAGAFSGSPNMEPDTRDYGNGDTLGNNDGTEPDPSMIDEPN
ncbi:hypothetical protein [Spirosoma daeguense]